jgi:hypothetical protein
MKSSHISLALVILLIVLCLPGCGPKQSTDQEKVASLPDLPQADVDKLKAVPNTHVLATSRAQARTSPSPVTTPPPPCEADAREIDYTAEVSYPITVCRSIAVEGEAIAGYYIERQGPTSRVANSKLPPELQSLAGNAPGAGVNTAWWVCRTGKGPWQGWLAEQHLCTITCETLFSLVLTNAPNPVEFPWDTSLGNHHFDPDFQFVGQLVNLGTTDLGSCHTPPPPPPAH